MVTHSKNYNNLRNFNAPSRTKIDLSAWVTVDLQWQGFFYISSTAWYSPRASPFWYKDRQFDDEAIPTPRLDWTTALQYWDEASGFWHNRTLLDGNASTSIILDKFDRNGHIEIYCGRAKGGLTAGTKYRFNVYGDKYTGWWCQRDDRGNCSRNLNVKDSSLHWDNVKFDNRNPNDTFEFTA